MLFNLGFILHQDEFQIELGEGYVGCWMSVWIYGIERGSVGRRILSVCTYGVHIRIELMVMVNLNWYVTDLKSYSNVVMSE